MSSSDDMDSSPLDSSSIRYDAYAVLVAFGVAAILVVCFWQLYKLTVSARPQDMLPVSSSTSGSGGGKTAPLRQSDIAALPVFVHGGGAAAVECAVCLAEMRDGEKGRLLPGCDHRFHVECIDRWFRTNSTCPLCRVAAFGEPSAAEALKVVVPIAAGPAVAVPQG